MSAPRARAKGGVLAIDHGTKRTGFAVSDALRLGVFALEPFHGDGGGTELVEYVARLCDERAIATFLVGFPYDATGGEGGRARDVRAFTERLGARFPGTEVVLYDERLTTRMAAASRRGGAAAAEDSLAAAHLLDSWLLAAEARR